LRHNKVANVYPIVAFRVTKEIADYRESSALESITGKLQLPNCTRKRGLGAVLFSDSGEVPSADDLVGERSFAGSPLKNDSALGSSSNKLQIAEQLASTRW